MPKAKGRKRDDDDRPAESEARAIDIKVKGAEDGETNMVGGNLDLLKKMQEEKWKSYGWIDAEVCLRRFIFGIFGDALLLTPLIPDRRCVVHL
jgi:hypothetical protein